MPVSNIVRNLRDGELVIKDGTPGTPQSLTVLLDEGDLRWTVRSQTIEVKDRGSIAAGHTRQGDDESVALSFTAKWTSSGTGWIIIRPPRTRRRRPDASLRDSDSPTPAGIPCALQCDRR